MSRLARWLRPGLYAGIAMVAVLDLVLALVHSDQTASLWPAVGGGHLVFWLVLAVLIVAVTGAWGWLAATGRPAALRPGPGGRSWGDAAADRLVAGPVLAVSRACLACDVTVVDAAVTGSARMVYRGGRLSSLFEKYVIYGIINTTAYANHVAAAGLRKIQSGFVHHYALIMTVGLLLLITIAMVLGLP